jgi:hypothetical protein
MIAADVYAKALSTYMGHSSTTITLDRYGHLYPGDEGEAARLLGAHLARLSPVSRHPCSDSTRFDRTQADGASHG